MFGTMAHLVLGAMAHVMFGTMAHAEFTVKDRPRTGGAPTNARWTKALGPDGYFEIKVVELGGSGCSIGIVTEKGFGKGYKCKGLFFNGNLSNGLAGLGWEFGERPKKGMVIGVRVEREGENVKVAFYQDRKPLGVAFEAKLDDGSASIYPVVCCGSDGDTFFLSMPDAPTAAAEAKGVHPAVGAWTLQRLCVGPELGQYPLYDGPRAKLAEGKHVMLDVKLAEDCHGHHGHHGRHHHHSGHHDEASAKRARHHDDDEGAAFSLTFRVSNRIGAHAHESGVKEGFHGLTVDPQIISTRMMGPLGEMETEGKIAEGLKSVHKWRVDTGRDTLLMIGATVEMELKRAPKKVVNAVQTTLP